MCGRFALTSAPEIIREFFGYEDRHEFPPRRDIAPTQPIAVVVAREFTAGAERSLRLMRWGFLPGFAKDLQEFPLIVNARAEGVLEKPSFSAAFRRRRCLAPADGFYASRPLGGRRGREPCFVQASDGAPLGLAALWETYLDRNGSEIDTVCIITTSANATLSAMGERMPAILPRAAFTAWLDHEATPLDAAAAMLRPAPETMLRITDAADEVSSAAATFR